MREIKFRAWHKPEKKLYFRGYQKLSHVLLCDDDLGKNGGNGIPVRKASYDDCVMLESSSVVDKNGSEIYEGDIVRITAGRKNYADIVGPIIDMFKSRKLHPLHHLLAKYGLSGQESDLEFEIIGNQFCS